MDVSSRLAADNHNFKTSYHRQQTQSRAKSSRGGDKLAFQSQAPTQPQTNTVNITPLSNVGVPQCVPGVGKALVIPALVTNPNVNVSGLPSTQMIISPTGMVQSSSHSIQLGSATSRSNSGNSRAQRRQEEHPSGNVREASQGHKANQRPPQAAPTLTLAQQVSPESAKSRGQGRGRTLARQDSESSVYSPISDEDKEESGADNRTRQRGSETSSSEVPAGGRSEVTETSKDILKEAVDLILFDLKEGDEDLMEEEYSFTQSDYADPTTLMQETIVPPCQVEPERSSTVGATQSPTPGFTAPSISPQWQQTVEPSKKESAGNSSKQRKKEKKEREKTKEKRGG